MNRVDSRYIINTVTANAVTFDDEENIEINRLILEYADKMKDSHEYYSRKRNVNLEVAYQNDLTGKKGEYVTRDVFYSHFKYPILKPDLTIYAEGFKSFDPDLPYGKKYANLPNVHVKTCDSSRFKYADSRGKSWTFQFKNNDNTGGKDLLFKNAKLTDLVAFVYLDDWQSNYGIVEAIIPLQILIDENYKLFEDPVSKTYSGLKKCVYLETLHNNKELIEK